MNIRPLAKLLYGLFGTIFLAAGVGILSLRTGLLPEPGRKMILDLAAGDLNAVHLLQEFGAMLVFAGLISFWFVRRYEQSKYFHWAMTMFWALFALAHWYDARGDIRSVKGPLINSIPFGLFLVVGLMRKR